MKVAQFAKPGPPEVFEYADAADPKPGNGQALVNVQAVGVNYTDVYSRSGLYPSAKLPAIPGTETSGTVAEIGPGVTEVKVGDRVVFTGVPATYAERVVAPARRLVKIPAGLDFEKAVVGLLQGITAQYLSHSTYPVKQGETVLIHAGAGGIGRLLIQMCKWRGATVITTVSTDEKAAVAKEAGADHAILYAKQDFEAEVLRITGGAGVPVVFDSVGKDTFDKSLGCLTRRGVMVLFGNSSGMVDLVSPTTLNRKSLYLTRPSSVDYTTTRQELTERADMVLNWVKDGKLKLHVSGRFPLKDAASAHRMLEGRQSIGKLLLVP